VHAIKDNAERRYRIVKTFGYRSREYARLLYDQAQDARTQGQSINAGVSLLTALRLQAQLGDSNAAYSAFALASLFYEQHKYQQSLIYAVWAVKTCHQSLGIKHALTLDGWWLLGLLYLELGDNERGWQCFNYVTALNRSRTSANDCAINTSILDV